MDTTKAQPVPVRLGEAAASPYQIVPPTCAAARAVFRRPQPEEYNKTRRRPENREIFRRRSLPVPTAKAKNVSGHSLPLPYHKEAPSGFGPENEGFADPCLTTWLWRRIDGAVDETRTRDLNLGKVALYQLSYYRRWCLGAELNHRHVDFQSTALPTELPRRMATWKGLEPSTSSVTGWHSNQLNYRTAWWEQQGSNL